MVILNYCLVKTRLKVYQNLPSVKTRQSVDSGKLLLVENDPKLNTALEKVFINKGFAVTAVYSLQQAYRAVDSDSFSLAVIDRILGDGDGLDLVEYLHESSFQTKTLVLTEKSEVKHRIEGLEKGADDYLGKPFSQIELTLRLRALINKQKLKQHQWLQTKQAKLYFETGLVVTDLGSVRLRKKEASILACLFRYQNRVVSRSLLIEEVWRGEDTIPLVGTVDVYIRRLRQRLNNLGVKINTIRGFGYRVLS